MFQSLSTVHGLTPDSRLWRLVRRDEAGTAMHLAPRGPADGQTEVLLKTSVTSQNIHSSTTNITRPAHRACGSGFRRAAVGVQFHNRATLCAYGTHCVMCVIAAHDTLWLRCLCAALHCVLQAWGGFARGCGRSDVARRCAQSCAWRCVTPSHFAMHTLGGFSEVCAVAHMVLPVLAPPREWSQIA